MSLPPSGCTSGSTVPWMTSVGALTDRSRSLRLPEARMARSCRPTPAGLRPRSKVRSARERSSASSSGKAADAQHLPGLREAREIFLLGGRRRRHQHGGGFAGRRRHFGIAGRRHDRGQRAHPLRKRDRDFLGDHAAHRRADQMRRLDAERVHQPDRVLGHVAQLVGRRDRDFQEAQLEQFDRASGACRRRAGWTCRCRGCRSG